MSTGDAFRLRLPKTLRRRAALRCWCGRPVPSTSLDGYGCAEHDYAPSWPARFDERYDPSPEPIDRSIQ